MSPRKRSFNRVILYKCCRICSANSGSCAVAYCQTSLDLRTVTKRKSTRGPEKPATWLARHWVNLLRASNGNATAKTFASTTRSLFSAAEELAICRCVDTAIWCNSIVICGHSVLPLSFRSLFSFSPPNLQEIAWPIVPNFATCSMLAQIYKIRSEIWRPQNIKISAISRLDRECLRNATRCR